MAGDSKDKLKIPQKCKVGFNLRADTYTGKLGYVIYQDGKTWRKEQSWNGWIQKPGQDVHLSWQEENGQWKSERKKCGDDIKPIEFDNVPTSGFVLNKKAGGYSSGWNARATYCRIYDPRGFEFEVSIPNLLFILQESNSMKGKGLEGEFVYSWEGKDLVLLPCSSNEYQKSLQFTKNLSNKISTKELVIGATYETKQQDKLVYLGKLDYCEYKHHNLYDRNRDYSVKRSLAVEKKFIFYNLENNKIEALTGAAKLSHVVNPICHTDFVQYLDKYNKSNNSAGIESTELIPIKIEDFKEKNDTYWNHYIELKNDATIFFKFGSDLFSCSLYEETKTVYNQEAGKHEYVKGNKKFNYINPFKIDKDSIFTGNTLQINKNSIIKHPFEKEYNTLEGLIAAVPLFYMEITKTNGTKTIYNDRF